MNKKNRSLAVAGINFNHIKIAYLITFLAIAFISVDFMSSYFGGWSEAGTVKVSIGNYMCLLAILAPILIVAKNFTRIMNLGGKKKDFYWGCLLNYVAIAIMVSGINSLFYYLIDKIFEKTFITVNIMEVFGWTKNNAGVAFFQQAIFLVLLQVFIHTLTSIQGSPIGWTINILLIAIISIFTPIAPLRAIEAKFFHLILFASPMIQITSCLILIAIIYGLYKVILNRKQI